MIFGHDKVSFVNLPTPLEYLPAISREQGVEFYIKRDDLTNVGWGGNKLRKLEYLLKDAQDQGATMLITCGGTQTNHGRLTAAVAAKFGMRCAIAVIGEYPGRMTGNLLLDGILDADVVFSRDDERPWAEQVNDAMEAAAEKYGARGEKPYIIPSGGSNDIGILGYYECAMELTAQSAALGLGSARVCVPMGSGGTFMGLFCGLRNERSPLRLTPVLITNNYGKKEAMALFSGLKARYPLNFDAAWEDMGAEAGYVREGYNLPNRTVREAIYYMARREGIFLDPCYNGKCFAGVLDMIREGKIARGETIILMHTGGVPQIYNDEHRAEFEKELMAGIIG